MDTLNIVHGHAVLELLAQAPLTRAQLDAELTRQFGPDVRFRTCSAQGLTCDQLLDLLISKGKVSHADGMLSSDPAHICKHH